MELKVFDFLIRPAYSAGQHGAMLMLQVLLLNVLPAGSLRNVGMAETFAVCRRT